MSDDHLLVLVAASAGVEPLVAAGAGEAVFVPGLEQSLGQIISSDFYLHGDHNLELLCKVDSLLAFGANISASPLRLSSCSQWCQ